MKKNIKIILTLVISLFFAGNSYAWTIADFHSNIQLQTDGSAIITETITGDFSASRDKHGIFRYIPYESKTTDGRKNYTQISLISVSDGQKIPRNFTTFQKKNNLVIKIGDADRYVNKNEVYVIKYKIEKVPKEFAENNFAEFYWNVTGDDWDAVINRVSVTISLPQKSKIQKMKCFTGVYGSTEENCTKEKNDQGEVIFMTNNSLNIGEGFTVVYGFDKGIIKAFVPEEIPWWKDFFNRIGVWILSALMPLISIFYAWNEKRKLKVDKPIIPKYELPEGLHPTMVGTVIDGRYDKRDFTAGIIDLAVHGLLEVEKKKVKGLIWDSEEYFLKQNPAKNHIEGIRASFYTSLFSGDLVNESQGETGVYPYKHREKMYKIFMKINNQAESKKYFKSYLSGPVIGVGALIFISPLIFFLLSVALERFNINEMTILVSLFISMILFFVFKPKRNKAGFELAHEAKCYREFLATAEADQLNWAEKQEIFEKNLPYAVAFGLTGKWTKVFGETIQVPQWMHTGSIDNLSRDISSITSDISQNIQAPKSTSSGSGFSSGGGFSGGGSGGGGGGSW